MKLKHILSLVVVFFSSLMLSALPINDLRNTIQDNNIVPPSSFETSAEEMKNNWYIQNYTELAEPKEKSKEIITPTDETYIERLQRLQNEMGFEIEMPYNNVVKSYIEMYTSNRRKALVKKMLGMWLYYEPIFEEALAKEGMPLELKYLPIIESALDPNAVSLDGAAGLWKFSRSTGKGLGLEVNSLVDERRDTYKASQKAAEFLKSLYKTYGDWSLAIVAYNCGSDVVNNAIRRSGGGKKDYWEIYNYLPKETRGYVPAFIAAAYIMNYHNEHGISSARAKRPILTDTVWVKQRLNFKQISDVIDLEVDALETLNPQYRENIIPGSYNKPYVLILPSKQVYSYLMSENTITLHDAEEYALRKISEPRVIHSEQNDDVAVAQDTAKQSQNTVVSPAPKKQKRQYEPMPYPKKKRSSSYADRSSSKVKSNNASVAQNTQTTSADENAEPTAKQSQKTVVTKEPTKVKMGFLILESNPSGAEVFITQNGEKRYEGNTPFQKKMPYGSYNYRIKKQHYHDEKGVVVLDSTRVIKKVELRSTFGSLVVITNPSGAKVTLESDGRSFTSPCKIENIPSGEHYVSIVSPQYSLLRKKVLIQDGKTTPLNTTLDARFAQVTINTLPNAKIVINGEQRGVGGFVGELDEGTYAVEVSLAQHRNVTRQIKVVAKQPQTITINPTPIYGSLDVITTPMYAEVEINGKNYGTTPTTIENLLVGDYEVKLSKDGCAPQSRKVTISENNLSTLEVELPQSREMTICSDAQGDEVYVDGVKLGVTPLVTKLLFGIRKIELRRGDKIKIKYINVSPTGENNEIRLGFIKPRWARNVTPQQKRVLENLIKNMVDVEGGTFMMGATSEQGSDADSDEMPVHQVTLSDYYIGKYEVIQEQWEAVMGSNPSYNKGANKPVDNVSKYDCQEFITKLNELTGLKFRLPTEAEWEYAARGGNNSKGYKYSGSNSIDDVAWYYDNSSLNTHEVGTKAPNELGIYDMSGNVHEWCSDRYVAIYYSSSPSTNPTGPSSSYYYVYRGGSRFSRAGCRVSSRSYYVPTSSDGCYGFRLVLCP